MSKLGSNLRLLRKRRGLSQIELGKLSDITERTIYNYEVGENYPKQKNIAKLARALGVSEELLETADLEKDIDQSIEQSNNASNKQTQEILGENFTPQYGRKVALDVSELLDKTTNLFNGDELTEIEKDELFESVAHMYFVSKRKYRLKRKI